MKPVLTAIACWLSTLQLFASDASIDVGGTQLNIPVTSGFAPVTPEMTRLIAQLDAFVTPVNRRFLHFLDETELAKAKTGRSPSIARVCSVQCAQKSIEQFATKADFTKLKTMIREQNVEILRKVEKEMPGYMDNANKAMRQQFDWKGIVGLNGYLPAGSPEETDRSISLPMYVKYDVTGPDGRKNSGASVVIATFLHLKGKIVFLYCNGEENDLSLARTLAKDWASAIIAANPSDAATAAKESSGSAGSHNWKAVPWYVIVGGVIAIVWSIARRFQIRRS